MLRNITWLGAASFAVKPVWFVFIAILTAEVLGAEGFGVLTVALSLAAIASGFTDLGMGRYTVREVARDHGRASAFFSNFFLVRTVLVVAAVAAGIGAGYVLGYRGPVLMAVVFAGLYTMGLNLITYARTYFQAFEVLRYEAVSLVVEKTLVVGAGLAMLYLTRSPAGTLAGMAAGMLIVTALTVGWIHRRLAPFRPGLFSFDFVRAALSKMVPFAVAALFTVVYMRTDLLMVEQMKGAVDAGRYALAFRILEALNLLPMIIATSAIYPRLSALGHRGDVAGAARVIRQGMLALAGIGLAAALAITLAGPPVVDWIIRVRDIDIAFGAAVPALQVLIWNFPFACVNALLIAGLIAVDQQRFMAGALVFATMINVILNVFAIPPYGIIGAASATVLSEVVLFALYGVRLRRYFFRFPARDRTVQT